MDMHGEVVVVCGPMHSGKSEALLFHIDKLRWAKIPFLVFSANIGKQRFHYAEISIATITIDIDNPKKILDHVDLPNVKLPLTVIIDEGHFYSDDIVEVVIKLAKYGVKVLIAGLDMCDRMKPFGSMPNLMAIATRVIKTTAACTKCPALATKTGSDNKHGDIRKGGTDSFYPLCTKCWHKLNPEEF